MLMPATTTRVEYYELRGGLNMVTPAIVIKPGFCIDAYNFEPDINGGYKLTDGTERYDGQESPSNANYWIINLAGGNTVVANNFFYSDSSQGYVVKVEANRMIVTALSGDIEIGETIALSPGGVSVGTATSQALVTSESDYDLNEEYTILAQLYYRGLIGQVPGINSVRGVQKYNGILYAVRDSLDSITAGLWKESDSGWQSIPLGFELEFNTGTDEIFEGDTIIGATSGATAVVARVVLESGTWAGTAAGRLIFAEVTGDFQAAELIEVSASNKATVVDVQTAITINAGGHYEFVNNNFTGSTDTYRMYGVSGVDYAFEFDGTTYVPLHTGMSDDKPSHIAAHKNQLFLGFKGAAQHSGIGTPYKYTLLSGGAEIGAGDTITNLLSLTSGSSSGALAITTTNKIYTLYGNSAADWNLQLTSPESGALAYSAQNMGNGMYFDFRGIHQLGATQAWGNFERSMLSSLVQPIIDTIRNKVIGSSLYRSRNQYRLYGSDGSGIIVSMDGSKIDGIMPINAGREITCMITADRTGEDDEIYFGSTDGFVYKITGSSWDGDAREFRLSLPFNNLKSPTVIKKYRKAEIGIESQSSAKMSIGYELGYSDSRKGQPGLKSHDVAGTGGRWDDFTWDEFTWDSPLVNSLNLRLSGSSINVGLSFYGVSAYIKPFTIQSIILHYTPRRLKR